MTNEDLQLLREQAERAVDCNATMDGVDPRDILWMVEVLTAHALPSGVRVKPLEWEPRPGVDGTFDAYTDIGHFIATITDDDRGMWFLVGLTQSNYCDPDIEKVKAAAQADYERRILSALSPAPVGVKPTHRHKKRGSEYVLIGYGRMQAENWWARFIDPDQLVSVDMREVAIYRSIDDGALWVRPRKEFEDGRFEALSSAGEKEGPFVTQEAMDELNEGLGRSPHSASADTQEGLSVMGEALMRWSLHTIPATGTPKMLERKDGDWVLFDDAQSALTACQQEVERLTQERDEALEAENEAKDCFWAIYPDWVDMKGHGITTEAARTLLADRAEAAEARVAELKKALEPFAKAPSHGLYGGPMVQAILTYEDSTDENTARHRGRIGPEAFRRARAALSEGEQ